MLSLFSASVVVLGRIIIFLRCGGWSSRSFIKSIPDLVPSKDVISTFCNMKNI
ncbi:hypothetical protein Hanom_Chr09g00862151 [Helianthus anomalus]